MKLANNDFRWDEYCLMGGRGDDFTAYFRKCIIGRVVATRNNLCCCKKGLAEYMYMYMNMELRADLTPKR